MPERGSASSRLLDLKSEAARFTKRNISATIVADVKRFSHQINTDEVFGAHRGGPGPEQAACVVDFIPAIPARKYSFETYVSADSAFEISFPFAV
jgi:hypothetical protein